MHLSGDNWTGIYHDCLRCTNWASLYFFSFVVLITYVLLNFYLGTVWENVEHTYSLENGALSLAPSFVWGESLRIVTAVLIRER